MLVRLRAPHYISPNIGQGNGKEEVLKIEDLRDELQHAALLHPVSVSIEGFSCEVKGNSLPHTNIRGTGEGNAETALLPQQPGAAARLAPARPHHSARSFSYVVPTSLPTAFGGLGL